MRFCITVIKDAAERPAKRQAVTSPIGNNRFRPSKHAEETEEQKPAVLNAPEQSRSFGTDKVLRKTVAVRTGLKVAV